MLILQNPFLLIVSLLDLVQDLERKDVSRDIVRAGMIGSGVLFVFALEEDAIFTKLIQAHFESFQIFGGVIILLIGIQFVLSGHHAMTKSRGTPEHSAGSIALPIMIGPGTVNARIFAATQLPALMACVAILVAIMMTVRAMMALTVTHDKVKPRNEKFIERYVEISGRITALVAGINSIEMIMQGLKSGAEYF